MRKMRTADSAVSASDRPRAKERKRVALSKDWSTANQRKKGASP